jgi:hypothetical protein
MGRRPKEAPQEIHRCKECGKKHQRRERATAPWRPTCAAHAKDRSGRFCRRWPRANFPVCEQCGAGYASREASGDKIPVGLPALTHGRYSRLSRLRLGTVLAELEADPDLLDRVGDALSVEHAATLTEMVERVSKIVERVERGRAGNAVSRPELMRLMGEMGRVVETLVRDPDPGQQPESAAAVKAKIRDGWLRIPLASS